MSLKSFIAVALFAAPLGSAQNVGVPMAGVVLDDAGRLIPVHGVFGTLLRGEPVALPSALSGAPLSASFSDTSGLWKSAAAFVITDGSGEQQFTLPTAETGAAMASFAAEGSLQWFCAGSCDSLQNSQGVTVTTGNAGGAIVALGTTAGQSVPVLTQSGTQLWSCLFNVTDQSTSHQVSIAGGLPAVAFNAGWITTSAGGLIWTDPNGATTAIAVSEPVQTLQNSGSRTVCINGRWILNSALQILEIPVKPHYATKPKTAPGMVKR